mgnify:CR=1 FL=1
MSNEFEKYAIKHVGIGSNNLHQYQSIMNDRLEASITPYILEEREMRVTQIDVFSRLLRDRILWVSGAIHDKMSPIIQAQLMFLDDVDREKDVRMHLDTPGGGVYAGLSIIDVMDYIAADVATVNTGMCASMGSVLLGAGKKGKRSALKNSRVMMHQSSGGASGNIQDAEIAMKEWKSINETLFEQLSKYCNKPLNVIKKDATRDKWLTATEAIKYGLIDNIVQSKKK